MTRRNKRAAWFGHGADVCHAMGFLSGLRHGPRVGYRAWFKSGDRRRLRDAESRRRVAELMVRRYGR